MDLKVAEGSPIGYKTGLGPPLPRLRRGDKGGAGIVRGVVRGGEGVQWAFCRSRATGADVCQAPR